MGKLDAQICVGCYLGICVWNQAQIWSDVTLSIKSKGCKRVLQRVTLKKGNFCGSKRGCEDPLSSAVQEEAGSRKQEAGRTELCLCRQQWRRQHWRQQQQQHGLPTSSWFPLVEATAVKSMQVLLHSALQQSHHLMTAHLS